MPSTSPEPRDVIKAPDPHALSRMTSTSSDPSNESTGASNPIGVLLPRPRDTWSPLARRGATGALTTTPTPADGTDVTMYSQQEHENHALTQHDPGHHNDIYTSTAMRVMTTVPPTPLSMQIRAPVPPILDSTDAHRTKHGHNM
jgi:hypothetical protein